MGFYGGHDIPFAGGSQQQGRILFLGDGLAGAPEGRQTDIRT